MSDKVCPKCGGEMLSSYSRGHFSGMTVNNVCGGTDTTKYMCKKCGYIEEWADEPDFWGDDQ